MWGLRHDRALSLLVVVVAASVVAGEPGEPPTLSTPEKVYGTEGQYVWVKVTTNCKWVDCVAPPGLELFPQEKLKDPFELGFLPLRAGTFEVWVTTGNDQAAKRRVLIVANAPPTPGPKPPDPNPKPPDPNPPKPPGYADPALVAQFVTALQADMVTYPLTDQPGYARTLGQCYLESIKKVEADTTNQLTFGQLYNVTFDASVAAGVPRRDRALTAVRKVIDGLGKHDPATVLAGADKTKYVDLWHKVGASLVEAAGPPPKQ